MKMNGSSQARRRWQRNARPQPMQRRYLLADPSNARTDRLIFVLRHAANLEAALRTPHKGASACTLYSDLDVGLPAFYHQSELLGRPLRQGKDVANRVHRIWHQQHGCGGLDRDRRISVDPFKAHLHRFHVFRGEIHKGTLPLCSSRAPAGPISKPNSLRIK